MGNYSSKQPGPTAYDLIPDSCLHKPTDEAIHPFADGVKIRSFPIDSVGDIPENFLDTHPEVVASSLKSKKKIWKNKEFLDLVQMFLDSSSETINFLATSQKECLDRARNSHSIVQSAINSFKKDTPATYNPTIEKLKAFKAAGDPFSDDFFSQFEYIYKKQADTWNKLIDEKIRLDAKLKSVRMWRKVSKIILIALFAAVVILTVVAAAITAAPVAIGLAVATGPLLTGLAAAAAVPLGPMPALWSAYWNKKEMKIKGESGIVSAASGHALPTPIQLENIQEIVKSIETDFESLLEISELGDENQEDGLKSAIKGMRKKSNGLLKSIDKLEKRVDAAKDFVSWARKKVLKKLKKYEESA